MMISKAQQMLPRKRSYALKALGRSSPPELVVKLLKPELQTVGWEDEHVSLDALVEALHESEEVHGHPLGKLLSAGQLGTFPLNHLLCAAGTAFSLESSISMLRISCSGPVRVDCQSTGV